jgi:hypothetical protein
MIHKIIIFTLLFISGGAIILIGVQDYFYVLFLAMIVGCFLLSTKTIKVSMPTIRNILLLFFLFLILLLLRGESLLDTGVLDILLKFIILIIFSVYVTTFFPNSEDFFVTMITTFEFIMKLSLFTFVVVNLVPSLLIIVTKAAAITNDQYQTFFGLAFSTTNDVKKYHFVRNQSVFWEPGVYCVIINSMFMIKVFYLNQKKKLYWYWLAIFTSISMGGIIVFCLINVIRPMLAGSKENVRQKLPALALLIGIPLFVAVNFIYTYSSDLEVLLGAVFHRDLSNDASVNTRYQDFYYGFLAAEDQIWVGHGQDFTDYYKVTLQATNTSKAAYNGGLTNSLISIFYSYGIFYLIAYMVLMFKSAVQLSLRYALIIFFGFIGMLMLEPLHFSLFMVYIFTFRIRKKKKQMQLGVVI